MPYKTRILLKISFDSINTASNVLSSLSPDNLNIPQDLYLNFFQEGNELIIEARSENIKRLRSTLEEILVLISSLEKL
ncbi:MAG: KEOPS complex subunit Pcc1 [Thermoproteota archaeon]|jgi:tRNA threonylcarbamoyladenosine modification (KEOPS) complex  Pcc1 subunit|nr:KEOPS complex subunit Pcc1 [Thermoproteota archaeon]